MKTLARAPLDRELCGELIEPFKANPLDQSPDSAIDYEAIPLWDSQSAHDHSLAHQIQTANHWVA